jgi:hypothetical protein
MLKGPSASCHFHKENDLPNGRFSTGQDRSKNHKETKDQPAHLKESTQRTGQQMLLDLLTS